MEGLQPLWALSFRRLPVLMHDHDQRRIVGGCTEIKMTLLLVQVLQVLYLHECTPRFATRL